MFIKGLYTELLLDAILFSIYDTFSVGTSLSYTPGAIDGLFPLLQELGLTVRFYADGFDVFGSEQAIAGVRWLRMHPVSLLVQPVSVVFKALALLGQPILFE